MLKMIKKLSKYLHYFYSKYICMMKYTFLKCISVILYILVLWTMISQLQVYRLLEDPREGRSISRSHFTPGWEYNTPFPVDVVYTWINGSDPIVLKDLQTLKNVQRINPSNAINLSSMEFHRFADNEALRYSLRSLERNANWIRHVFIVTNGQVPDWLDLRNPRVTIVRHEDIFDEPANLPTFNSRAIEHNIHKVKGLSERFLYLNDDFLFGRRVSLNDFYTDAEVTKIHLAWHADAMCDTECHARQIQNGICEEACNYLHCAWDGGDCYGVPMETRPQDSDEGYFTYKTSLFYTNAIYGRAFGYKKRRVVAHSPLFVEKTVKKEINKRFSKEVCETTRHKLRGPLDLQFQFSYVHFLMEEYKHLRRFDVRVFSPEVSFVSVTNNLTKTQSDLNMIRENRSKFICINNNIDYTHIKVVERVEGILNEFYKMMFPDPSLFELPNRLQRFGQVETRK